MRYPLDPIAHYCLAGGNIRKHKTIRTNPRPVTEAQRAYNSRTRTQVAIATDYGDTRMSTFASANGYTMKESYSLTNFHVTMHNN